MRRFAELCEELDAGGGRERALAALGRYLAEVAPRAPADAACALRLLDGAPWPRLVSVPRWRALASCLAEGWAGVPPWLFEASLAAAGDPSEALALLLDEAGAADAALAPGLAQAWQQCADLVNLPKDVQDLADCDPLRELFLHLSPAGRYWLARVISGGLRLSLEPGLLARALAAHSGLPPWLHALRLESEWTPRGRRSVKAAVPDAATWRAWLQPAPSADEALAEPCAGWAASCPVVPLQPAPTEAPSESLPTTSATSAVDHALEPWCVDAWWLGERVQLVCRQARSWLWSQTGELLTGLVPEVQAQAASLSTDAVLDGQLVLADTSGEPPTELAEVLAQRRRARSARTTPRRDAALRFIALDLLSQAGRELRGEPLLARRALLQQLPIDGAQQAAQPPVPLRCLPAGVREAEAAGVQLAARLQAAEARGAEGLLLRHAQGRLGGYGGDGGEAWRDRWCLLRSPPLRVDAVFFFAEASAGGDEASGAAGPLFGFAVWNRRPAGDAEVSAVAQAMRRREPPSGEGLQLVTLVRTREGLSDADRTELERVLQSSTVQRFGPVRSVAPRLVVELALEGIAPSRRHKCGLRVRSARMLRVRHDCPLASAQDLPGLMQRLGIGI